MPATTPIYGFQYPVVGEPARTTRAILENNAKKAEAMGQAKGVAAPGASDLLAVAGRVTALESARYAILRGSGTMSLANATWTAVPFAQEDADPLGGHTLTGNTSRWTCPSFADGVYMVMGNARIDGGTDRRIVGLRKNNVDQIAFSNTESVAAADPMQVTLAPGLIVLGAGDYVEMFVYQESGAALTVNLTGTNLSLLRVGLA